MKIGVLQLGDGGFIWFHEVSPCFPTMCEGMGFTVKGFRICWKVRHRAERAEQEGEAVAGPLDIADVQLLGAKKSAFILKQIFYGPKLGYWLESLG